MNKKLLAAMPFLIMPIFLPIYMVLDSSILVLVDAERKGFVCIFSCGAREN